MCGRSIFVSLFLIVAMLVLPHVTYAGPTEITGFGHTYRVIRPIGKGMFGRVYLVADEQGMQYAIKVYRSDVDLASIHTNLNAFAHNSIEGVLPIHHAGVAQIDGANEFVAVYELAQFDVMRVQDRFHLENREHARSFEAHLDEAIRLLDAIVGAVMRMGQLGLSHRDIKPENIFVLFNGEYVLADLDTAKSEQRASREIWGTPGYIAPESYASGDYSFRTDLYGVGMTLVTLVSDEASKIKSIPERLRHIERRITDPRVRAKFQRLSSRILQLIDTDPNMRAHGAASGLSCRSTIRNRIGI